ncbi:MAG: hypothetical protein LBT48_09140, partial [Prevotellaceae bacterium]|nr:hypothetical protein [Prevotellaceae bacterium]
MKNLLHILLLFAAICTMSACNGTINASPDYMTLDDVEYVTAFPRTYALENAADVDVATDVL